MGKDRENSKRFLVTVVGEDHWKPEVREWVERAAGTTADEVLAEFRKRYPPPYQVVVVPERQKTSGMG